MNLLLIKFINSDEKLLTGGYLNRRLNEVVAKHTV